MRFFSWGGDACAEELYDPAELHADSARGRLPSSLSFPPTRVAVSIAVCSAFTASAGPDGAGSASALALVVVVVVVVVVVILHTIAYILPCVQAQLHMPFMMSNAHANA